MIGRASFLNRLELERLNRELVIAGIGEYPGDIIGAGRQRSGYLGNLIDYLAGQDQTVADRITYIANEVIR
jgi:hypothetical protein